MKMTFRGASLPASPPGPVVLAAGAAVPLDLPPVVPAEASDPCPFAAGGGARRQPFPAAISSARSSSEPSRQARRRRPVPRMSVGQVLEELALQELLQPFEALRLRRTLAGLDDDHVRHLGGVAVQLVTL